MHRMIASACLVAGLAILAGPGWALLAAGALLWWRDERAESWILARAKRARELWSDIMARVRKVPRRVVAGGSMVAGLVTAPAGFGVAAGAGTGLAVAGVMMVGIALLIGWGA